MKMMANFKFLKPSKIEKLPQTPGVYCFREKTEKFLYIGKATNLKRRVRNHFQKPGFKENLWLNKTKEIGYKETGSEIEALILESNLIKKYQPQYNIVWRDDKNYFFVGITKEDFPRVFWTHQTKVKSQKSKVKSEYIGPFVDGKALKKTLRTLRKIFPYYTTRKHPKTPCPYCHLGLCPGPNPDAKKYKEDIHRLEQVLRGKRSSVLRTMKKAMKEAAKKQDFEKAAILRDKIRALEKVVNNAKIFEEERSIINWPKAKKQLQKILQTNQKIKRIEAYDVSNIQGKEATGSMITFLQGKPDKNYYRRFKIRIAGKPNDVAMIKEILRRRLSHQDWGWPEVILIDGGKTQLNGAVKEIKKQKARVKKRPFIMALAKKKNELYLESEKQPILLSSVPNSLKFLILHLRDEAHRFAISYHRKLRRKKLLK